GRHVPGAWRKDVAGARALACDCAALHLVRSARGVTVSALSLREFHPFESAGKQFVYLAPSAAVFQLDGAAEAVLQRLGSSAVPRAQLVSDLSPRFSESEIEETLSELMEVRAVGETGVPIT